MKTETYEDNTKKKARKNASAKNLCSKNEYKIVRISCYQIKKGIEKSLSIHFASFARKVFFLTHYAYSRRLEAFANYLATAILRFLYHCFSAASLKLFLSLS